METGAPLVGLKDSGGARIQEGVVALDGYGRIFERNVRASGVIPQISVIMGPCAGGAVYSPAITDFVYQVDGTSHLFITGPDVIKTVTGEEVTFEDLGGAHAHAAKSGVTHFVATDGPQPSKRSATCLSFLPQNNMEVPPYFTPMDRPDRMDEDLDSIIPDSPNQPYDMVETHRDGRRRRRVLSGPRALRAKHRRRVRPARRLHGRHRRQPAAALAGTLDIDASVKAARFIRFCDAFNIPLVTLSTCPASSPASTRSTTASSATAPSCSTPTAKRPCPGSRSSPARRTAAPTSS